MNKEPVAILTAGIVAIINAGVVLARVFGWWDMRTDQLAALVGFITAVSGVVGFVMRAKVYCPATVERLLIDARSGG